ncbi:MAG: class I SAM-dependent RNA methyltransferase [Bryobacteraceae bacterium]|nr:class I SAM-dependent RNA methyltransferase [Bryobacteraceae bacterium]
MPQIEKLVYGGDGLMRVEGRVSFVPFSLPGEQWESGALVAASPDRIEAKCEYFSRCGGCHYQHLDYEKQLAAKRAILEETLARLGRITPPEIAVASAEPWGYRNRIQLHFERGQMGYHAAGSRKLIPVTHCPIASPTIENAIGALRDMRRDAKFPRFFESVELFSNETETLVNVLKSAKPVSKRFFDWAAERIPGATLSGLDYRVGGDTFHVSHKSFFQVNRFLVERLVELATGEESGGHALDLYAGVGLFTLPLSRAFERVTAVEVVRSAVNDLTRNAPQAKAIQQSTEDYLAQLNDAPNFVLADPPRAGLGKRAVEHLLRLRAPKLTVVSCDPATLARDLTSLIAGGYEIEGMTMIDLFPQTFHIETVTRLRLR